MIFWRLTFRFTLAGYLGHDAVVSGVDGKKLKGRVLREVPFQIPSGVIA